MYVIGNVIFCWIAAEEGMLMLLLHSNFKISVAARLRLRMRTDA